MNDSSISLPILVPECTGENAQLGHYAIRKIVRTSTRIMAKYRFLFLVYGQS